MEKIKHIPLFLFAITASKLLILGSDWASALTLLILAGTAAFWEFKVQDKRHKELEVIMTKQNETIVALAVKLDELRTNISAVKVAQGMRPGNVGRS
tara:strand:+ start:245 stop:535 length:291 start_codon:yes stop_codon:yes gene_type:complete